MAWRRWVRQRRRGSGRGRRETAMAPPRASSKPTIETLEPSRAGDRRLVGEIADLVNRVYAVAEAGFWVAGTSRTTTDEIARMIAAREIATASSDGRVVGSIRIQR